MVTRRYRCCNIVPTYCVAGILHVGLTCLQLKHSVDDYRKLVGVFRPRGGTKKVLVTLISREKAPENAYRDMFVNRTELALKGLSHVLVFRMLNGKIW